MTAKFESMQLRTIELKYCERCGNIWLRRSGSHRTLCAPCAKAEALLLTDGAVPFLQIWTRLRAEAQA